MRWNSSLDGLGGKLCFGWRTSETLQKCFLWYKNMRFWLSAVILLHWVDFCVQRKYVNNSAEFYLEEKPWSDCRMGTKPLGGRGDWTIQQLSEWQCLGLCSWLGERPDVRHLSSSLVSFYWVFQELEKQREGKSPVDLVTDRSILLASFNCYTSIALRRQCMIWCTGKVFTWNNICVQKQHVLSIFVLFSPLCFLS